MITQEQQNEMDRAITHWIANQMNACADREEQYLFMTRLLSASVNAFYYPFRHESDEKKTRRVENVCDLLGEIAGKSAAKFLEHKGK